MMLFNLKIACWKQTIPTILTICTELANLQQNKKNVIHHLPGYNQSGYISIDKSKTNFHW